MLSLVIPALNAAETLPACLDAGLDAMHAPGPGFDLEILVVDGGSTDGTATIARERGCRVIESAPGRGRQLAAGADAAGGDWLLFVHADTRLPTDWPDHVASFAVADRNRQRAGYFDLAFASSARGAKRVARWANRRARLWGLPYGDQGLLIHRDLYDAVGGYDPELDLMEDVDLVRRLGPMRVKPICGDGWNAAVVTSPVKYERGGWWARPMRNLACLALFLAGAPRPWVRRLYG